MKHEPVIAVFGLWHLGCVTAACLAQEHFPVWGIDPDEGVVRDLKNGKPPILEPGLTELIGEGQRSGLLKFSSDYGEALREATVVWVTFDTPVDENDNADVDFVQSRLDDAFPHIRSGSIVIISSQVPVGFTDNLHTRWKAKDPEKEIIFSYSPENLRLGKALKSFRAEDRIVVGFDGDRGRDRVENILSRFCPRLEWMSIKSAEMTKHALNSFLAVSVAMANEIARLCERTGADAKEVERGLKSESRIGPGAYLGPGGPFAGGTLARDARFLIQKGIDFGVETPLLAGALESNEVHKKWVQEAAAQLLEGVEVPARVSVLGLTYKAGTDTLRRSEAVNLGIWLTQRGVSVVFHDPVVRHLPEELAGQFQLTNQLSEALSGSDLLVISTGWPIYREEIKPELLQRAMRRAAVIDQTRFLAGAFEKQNEVLYFAVGKPRN
jgi:UDPglucose 6-dehydrogenase